MPFDFTQPVVSLSAWPCGKRWDCIVADSHQVEQVGEIQRVGDKFWALALPDFSCVAICDTLRSAADHLSMIEYMPGQHYLPMPRIDVSHAKPLPCYKRDSAFGMTRETRDLHSRADSGDPSIKALRDVVKFNIEDGPHRAFALHLGKAMDKLSAQELSDLIYANAWCKAWGKTMADYLSAGFYGVPAFAAIIDVARNVEPDLDRANSETASYRMGAS